MDDSNTIREIWRRLEELERRTGDGGRFITRDLFDARHEVVSSTVTALRDFLIRMERDVGHQIAMVDERMDEFEVRCNDRLKGMDARLGTVAGADATERRARLQFYGVVVVAILSLIGTLVTVLLR